MDDCSYCNGARLVGWSGAGPILCPTCSSGADTFTVITHAWREQRKRAIEAENERDRLRSALQAAELRIAAALAECAPTQADRYDYSAKEHSELAARVRALRERAEGAEIEGKARMSGMRKKLQVAERERDEARAEVEAASAERDKAKKEWQSCWEKVQRQAENLTNLNTRVNQLGAREAEQRGEIAELTAERNVALARSEKAERESDETHGRMVSFKREALELRRRNNKLDQRLVALQTLVKRKLRPRLRAATDMCMQLLAERDAARLEAAELRAEVERLRGALAWYADPNQWNGYYGNTDNGKRAREALGK